MRGFQGSTPPGNLPAELTTFVGRTAEVRSLKRHLLRSRLVTVTGPAGVGKSRCALAAAREAQERFCDGVWLVELATVRDPGLLEHAVAEALGVTDHSGRPPAAVLTDRLAGRRLLLVLDGYEPLVAPTAALVHELLRRLPGLRVLAAGRRPLEVAGERVVPLAPMSAPEPAPPESGEKVVLGESALLFAERAAAVVPGFAAEGNERLVAELCHRLDGIPLALELAAGRLRTLSLEQILVRLDDRFRLLVGGSRGAPAHHQTLRTAIGWSHELCSPAERLLWARLSVFAGHFDLEAVEYVCSGPELPAEDVLDVLTELVAQSVVIREDLRSGVRYRMLATLRAYGEDWLVAGGEDVLVRRRLRDWCTGLVTWCEMEWFSSRQAEVARRVEDELPNLRAALEFTMEDVEDGRYGLYLAATLWFAWVGCGRLREGRLWLERALRLTTACEETRLRALWALGYVATLQGDAQTALDALGECREEALRIGDLRSAAYSTHRTGVLALVSDETQRAEKLLREALRRYEEIGELNSNVLMARCELALAVAFQGGVAEALELVEGVRRVCEEHGERWARTYALYVLGFAAWFAGDTVRARRLLEECLPVTSAFRDLVGMVLALELMAGITEREGDLAEAAVLQGAAKRLWTSVGMPLFGSEYFNAPHNACVRVLRERLGLSRYEQCVSEGEALDLQGALARALRGGGGGGGRPALPEGPTRLPLPPAPRAPSSDDGEATGPAQRA